MKRSLFALLAFAAAAAPIAASADSRYDSRYGYDDRYGYDTRYGSDSGYGRGGLVDCHSNDRRTQICGVDTRGGVRLVRKVSRAACVEGRTWGYDQRGIWVANGCRATFELGGYGRAAYNQGYGQGYGYGNQAQVIRCESVNNQPRFCRVPNGVRGVEIQRRLSRAGCELDRSWGYRRDGVWVERGCRAEFRVY
jgi:hypothetical protein